MFWTCPFASTPDLHYRIVIKFSRSLIIMQQFKSSVLKLGNMYNMQSSELENTASNFIWHCQSLPVGGAPKSVASMVRNTIISLKVLYM